MSLRQHGMVVGAEGANALSLEMPAGKSARVTDIRAFVNAGEDEDRVLSINRKNIAQFIVPTPWGLLNEVTASLGKSIFRALGELGLLDPIPVAEGQTLALTAPGTSDYLELVYDLYDAADVSAEETNGSSSNKYQLFQVVSNSAASTASGDLPLDQSDLDVSFPAFPGGEVVPANYTFTLKALFGVPAGDRATSTDASITNKLKFLRDREDMFDMDMNGILFKAVAPDDGDDLEYAAAAGRLKAGLADPNPGIIVFEVPPIFQPGEELNIFANITIGATPSHYDAGGVKLGLLFDVQKQG